jgi:hypothetical protein
MLMRSPLARERRQLSEIRYTVLFALSVLYPLGAHAEVERLKDLPGAITACWAPPRSLQRLEVTVRFSLNSEGYIIGRPTITFSNLVADEGTNRQFVASILTALGQCTPVDLSPSFAAAFAGRPVTVRFVSDKKRKSIIPLAV